MGFIGKGNRLQMEFLSRKIKEEKHQFVNLKN